MSIGQLTDDLPVSISIAYCSNVDRSTGPKNGPGHGYPDQINSRLQV